MAQGSAASPEHALQAWRHGAPPEASAGGGISRDATPLAGGCAAAARRGRLWAMRAWRLAAVSILAWAAGCGGPREAVVETVADGARLEYRLESLTGVRDGDLLRTRLEFAGPPGPLVMEMRFRIGVPTRLESGRFRRQQAGAAALAQEGSVGEISSTFLGGQSDRPSIGGVFMLLGSGGAPLYRVTLPTTQLAGPR